jgi:Uma2 family endonuclease
MSSGLASKSAVDLETRKRWGGDLYDEVWDGVLHMAPMPNPFHQDIEHDLRVYLDQHWAKPRKARVRGPNNLAKVGAGKKWRDDFRIPDIILMKPDCFHIVKRTHLEGAPTVVIEIYSPGDESYDKLPWYLELGVPEVWIIHRDTLQPEIYVRKRSRWAMVKAAAEGWITSPETGVEMRRAPSGKLGIRMRGDPESAEELPME